MVILEFTSHLHLEIVIKDKHFCVFKRLSSAGQWLCRHGSGSYSVKTRLEMKKLDVGGVGDARALDLEAVFA